MLSSEAVFVADTLPWSTLVELLRFFGCFGCGSGRGRSSRSIATVGVVLSAGEVKPRARDQTSIAGGVPTPVAAPIKGRYVHPCSRLRFALLAPQRSGTRSLPVLGIGRPAQRLEIRAPTGPIRPRDRQAGLGQAPACAEDGADRQPCLTRHPMGGDVVKAD